VGYQLSLKLPQLDIRLLKKVLKCQIQVSTPVSRELISGKTTSAWGEQCSGADVATEVPERAASLPALRFLIRLWSVGGSF